MAKYAETPLMKQYTEMKKKHPDAVLLFRVGDFYETFSDDAVKASEILGITLTRRANGAAQYVELAGFPHHALDTYLPKLIRAGKRVAICEQLEDPKLTKKLVKRGITELVTPGIATTDTVLQHKENNFLAALHFAGSLVGVAFLDISTGEFLTSEGSLDQVDKLLSGMAPKELITEKGGKKTIDEKLSEKYITFELDDWIFTDDAANERLRKQFGTLSLKGFGISHLRAGIVAAGAILHYLDLTCHTRTAHINSIARIEEDKYVRLDRFTVRNLELLSPLEQEGKSLLSVLDRTVTPPGARLLHRWMLFPLKNPEEINRRLDVVDYFFRHPDVSDKIREQLSRVGDTERLLSKIASGRVNPREFLHLREALAACLPIKELCREAEDTKPLQDIGEQLNPCEKLALSIEKTISADAPVNVSKGGVIAEGVSEELDEYRKIAYSGKDYLMQIREREIEATGISSLKIGFNNIFGYYIEVTNTHKDKVPADWIRKQTLVNAERYITAELKDYEQKILTAQEKIGSLEQKIYEGLIAEAAEYIPALKTNAGMLARLDVLSTFHVVSRDNRYVRPIVDDSLDLELVEARHPVIERELPPGEPYISNTVKLSNEGQQILMITGPNMSGKSALLRQTALNVVMAQIGCFVAAESARIGIIDKIFTRVGASDNISLGESTFMVEMNEASSILNNLSRRSLILFDELGRGTSTYDGISIAWSIVEYLHEGTPAHPKTLFATHYHELNDMEKSFGRIANYNVSVKEADGKVVFLRKLAPGGSQHSFGIHVARLAGMPRAIVDRADKLLAVLESKGEKTAMPSAPAQTESGGEGVQLSFFQLDDPVLEQIRDELLNIDINRLTPLEALTKLHDIRTILTGKD